MRLNTLRIAPRIGSLRVPFHGLARLAATCLLCAGAAAQVSQETVKFFQQNCTSCHTIGGGRLVGPDLKDVTQRADSDWLAHFIVNPKAKIDGGDPYAQKLLQESRAVYMPTIPGMTREQALALIELIQHESGLEQSRFAGTQVSDRPLTPEDVARGQALFTGQARFAGGAPACMSCHGVAGLGGLGGGRLGPDLTSAYARLEGRKALVAWLSAPPSLTMQPVFASAPLEGEEVLALVAYLKDAAETGGSSAPSTGVAFLVAGMGLSVAFLAAFDLLWRRRFRAVRRLLPVRA